ncbi:hypothetical protein PHMEG_00026633 [Phytophthora megakarya]|uniref:RxLR effector protein n=1 Tax=Phytophthora megakarya TaxID=4795 RepID=A0A225V957_9STRA|nr:hypothetical protein PHMEG_00026633 [Phytophthora megakarya]
MRLIVTLVTMTAMLLAGCDNVVAHKSNTSPKLYAEVYRVENGDVTGKVKVPLGNVDQYKESDLKKVEKSLKAQNEERDLGLGGFVAYGALRGVAEGMKTLVVKDPSIGVTLAKGTLGLK